MYGCTRRTARNYDKDANTDDGSCRYIGCTNPAATNYGGPNYDIDDGSCIIEGCMDSVASNYNPQATQDDGNCQYISGCTDSVASNYNYKPHKTMAIADIALKSNMFLGLDRTVMHIAGATKPLHHRRIATTAAIVFTVIYQVYIVTIREPGVIERI